MSSINIAATKCPQCCSDIEPVEAGVVEDSDLAKGLKGLKKMAGGGLAKIAKRTKR